MSELMSDHKVIWLIPDGNGDASWCDDPAPSLGMDESEAIKYVREDCTDNSKELLEALKQVSSLIWCSQFTEAHKVARQAISNAEK